MSDSVITCGIQNISQLYMQMASNAQAGTLDSSVAYNFGMADGAQSLSAFSASVSTDVQDSVNAAMQDYLAGTITLDLQF
jgi:basic membrane lipoprotein Med (substrate-binding protein (PBP1-ABC) superfamily)